MIAWSAHAQDVAGVDSLRNRADSIALRSKAKADSLVQLKNRPLDSLDGVADNFSEHVNRYTAIPSTAMDSIRGISNFSAREATQKRLQSKIDSLNALRLPTTNLQNRLDSLRKKDPLINADAQVGKINSSVEAKMANPITSVNEKLNVLNQQAGGQTALPASVSPTLPNLPSTEPGMSLPETSVTDIRPSIDGSNLSIVDVNSNSLASKLPGVDASRVSDVSNEIGSYSSDARQITSGDLSNLQAIETDAMNAAEINELNAASESIGALESHKDMVRSLKDDEAFKKQALEKSRQIVAEQIASHGGVIVQAVNKVSSHQRRAGTIFSQVKGLPKRPTREKKPAMIERIMPSLTVQVQRATHWYVDINPAVHYRVRSIFSLGAGWNERIEFDNNFSFHWSNRVYGPRCFAEFSILKGLWVRGDIERMSRIMPVIVNGVPSVDATQRKSVSVYMAGLKKDFTFAPAVIGNIQFMYNLYNPKGVTPYSERFNIRFGFAFPMRQVKRK